ncbi:trafficking kinesin-binding protein milt isoform X2 [Oratosquilla oratoria]|uniref:trafficking kinesin-binding protein milt isoform X2 n=1 Tax=Oratosquilla oratoria TaxID=337810 RepID=UPI003F75DC84
MEGVEEMYEAGSDVEGDVNWGPGGLSTTAKLQSHHLWVERDLRRAKDAPTAECKEENPQGASSEGHLVNGQVTSSGLELQESNSASSKTSLQDVQAGTWDQGRSSSSLELKGSNSASSKTSLQDVQAGTWDQGRSSSSLELQESDSASSKTSSQDVQAGTSDEGTQVAFSENEEDDEAIREELRDKVYEEPIIVHHRRGSLTTKVTTNEEPPKRPFFYLPDEEEEEGGVEEGWRDSSVFSSPRKGLADVSKGLASSNLNHQGKHSEIQDRIRLCLQRARSRSSSLSGLRSGGSSFEAGLFRLRGLLDSSADPEGHLHRALEHVYGNGDRADDGARASLMPQRKDATTITDVCTGENVAEVEIISLVQEQIPQYRLRADTISQFAGYDNSDWAVPFPALREEEASALSPEQAEGALAYFVLCGNRVSQMTRTYNDIDAVTRLLEEKEKDLELAAKIGQQLLARNKGLEERNVALEAEISAAGDTITQLKHDLQMKTDLLQIYTNDVDDSSVDSTPTGVRLFNVEVLQHRVQNLEVENKSLRQEASQLASDTFDCESKEKELVHDVIRQLSDANVQVRQLSDELAKKVEDSLRQQEEITQLLAQVVDFQAANKRLVSENEELANMVQVARECQQELTTELAELKEKYAEVLDLLHDTQDQLRRVQKKNLPGSRGHYLGNLYSSSPFNSGSDSIANELTSLNSIGEEMSKVDGNSSMRRAFDTVRLTGRQAGIMSYSGSIHSTPTHQAQTLMGTPTHHGIQSSGSAQGYVPSYLSRPSSVYSSCSGHPSLDSGADSDASMHTDSEDNYPASHTGVPGWPGTQDLEFCIKRLGPGGRANTPSQFLPYGCRTPDSIMSTGSGKSGMSSSGSSRNADWRYPQKLQIVKPIEGSLTLHQWSRLATPHLGGLLEEREGVAIKGSTTQDLNLDVYSMSDLEEDEAQEDNPGKQFMSTSGIYTFTNSTVLHPDDQTSLTPSIQKAQVSVLPTNEAPGTPTPSRGPSCPPSRRGSTATFSTNVGLAKHLNERGIASLSSGYTPTATPANSPEGTRPGSPEPAGIKIPGFDELHKTFSYGAKMLRRTIYGEESKPPSPTVAPRINLVERVQEIGVDRFVGHTGHGALTVGGVVTSRPATSPLLHLSSLIMSSAKTTSTTMSGSSSLTSTSTTASNKFSSIMSTPKIPSPGERRPAVPQGAPLGIPGHPGSGHLDSRLSQLKPGQRADLGTVGSSGRRPRPTTLGSVPGKAPPSQDQNLGTVGWMSLGRKGGLL